MSYSSWNVQKAVFTALNGDAPLSAAVTGVYDEVPEGTALPYVKIGDSTLTDWSGKDFTGAEQTLTIHVWSGHVSSGMAGRQATKEIMALVHTVLHEASLTVANNTLVNLRFTFAEEFQEDGTTYHGVMRFRLITQGV